MGSCPWCFPFGHLGTAPGCSSSLRETSACVWSCRCLISTLNNFEIGQAESTEIALSPCSLHLLALISSLSIPQSGISMRLRTAHGLGTRLLQTQHSLAHLGTSQYSQARHGIRSTGTSGAISHTTGATSPAEGSPPQPIAALTQRAQPPQARAGRGGTPSGTPQPPGFAHH